jgi:nitroreductase
MNVLEAIDTRISVSALTDPGPTDAQWEILLRAGARAPDHGRLRPWRFLIVRGAARELLGEVIAEALRASKPDTPPEILDRERRKPLRAPALLVVAVVPVPHSGVPEIEQILAGGAAAQNILLAAHALGLGAIWRTGAPAYSDDVARALGLPAQSRIVAFIYLGMPHALAIRSAAVEPPSAVIWGQPRENSLCGQANHKVVSVRSLAHPQARARC